MLLGAYVVIVLLTWILVILNVRSVVHQYDRDHNRSRLMAYLITLLILASLIISVASAVVQRVIDAETFLKAQDEASPIRYYHVKKF